MTTQRMVLCSVAIAGILVAGRFAHAGGSTTPPDFTGEWKLDAKHSDAPGMSGAGPRGGGGWGGGRGGHMGGGMGGGGMGGGGGWGGRHRRGGDEGTSGSGDPSRRDPGSEASGRPARLPDFMHVTQTATLVSFEDSSGAVVREIATVAAAADTFTHAPGALHVSGRWDKDKLIVEHAGPRDSKITETLWLKDDGKTLVIDNKFESNGDMPSREFKRVYTKVTQT